VKIAFACDHGGFELKRELISHAEARGCECVDFGYDGGAKRVDYPEYGYLAAKAVRDGECDLGVLVCGTGVGMSLTANKMKGIRAVVCSEPFTAKLSRQHNDSNVLALGGRVVGPDLAKMILDSWLDATFEGGRHAERIGMVMEIDETGELRDR